MKFIDLLFEVNKKDINDALKNSDIINVGAEIECIWLDYESALDAIAAIEEEISDKYDSRHGEWDLHDDASIYTDFEVHKHIGGFADNLKFVDAKKLRKGYTKEWITPTYNLKDFLIILPQLLAIVAKYGYTNDTCGLHISLSLQGVNLNISLDKQRLGVGYEDGDITKDMPNRSNNAFAPPLNIKQRGYWMSPDEKNQAMRMHPIIGKRDSDSYVEVRQLGGKNYEYKWNTIRLKILKCAANLHKTYTDQEYMKKRKDIYSAMIDQKAKSISSTNNEFYFQQLLQEPSESELYKYINKMKYIIKKDDFWWQILRSKNNSASNFAKVQEFNTLIDEIKKQIAKFGLHKEYYNGLIRFIYNNRNKLFRKHLNILTEILSHGLSRYDIDDNIKKDIVLHIKNNQFPIWAQELYLLDPSIKNSLNSKERYFAISMIKGNATADFDKIAIAI